MRRTFLRTGFLSAGLGIIVYSATLFIPKFQTLGNDYSPPVPEFSSFRISNDFSQNDDFERFEAQMDKFMAKWGIVGVSVAIAKDDRLIYAKGFGQADKEANQMVQPYNLFRIASASKLVTAIGIMKMVEDGIISLETNVFGPNGILDDSIYRNYIDPRVELITVRQLLDHSAGWTNRYGDHMFMPTVVAKKLNKQLPVDENDIIRFALVHRLHFQPGSYSSYSNLGYVILGKVIEKVSGLDYENFIKTRVLFPLGIYDMSIGGSYLSERKDIEVKYYEADNSILVEDHNGSGEMVLRSYGGNDIKCLGAAGGWIASSTDLMKLMLAVNENPAFKDILSPKTIDEMVNPMDSQKSPLGWRRINEFEWVRTGTLASTSAIMVQRKDGISYVMISNTGSWKGSDFTSEIERHMNRSITLINSWPDTDLFKVSFTSMQPLESKIF
ncbi:MAG: serine hydrolase domain-containing protein [Breznakibacter sp.]